MILTIKLKGITPQSTHEERVAALKASAELMQGLNLAMQADLIHGPIKCNPLSETIEGFLGDVNGYPNELGVLDVVISNYGGLDLPYLPIESPFALSTGDTSRDVPTGEVTEEGEPIYTTVYAGGIAGAIA